MIADYSGRILCQHMYPNAEPAKIYVRFLSDIGVDMAQPIMYDAGLEFDMCDPRQSAFDRSHTMLFSRRRIHI